jgi:ABC-2 type transport system ATP-binding protein
MTSAVKVRNLTKRFAGFSLLDVSIDVPEGCVTAVFGPTGAGKTTLTKLIANVIRPDSGEVEVLGMSYATNESEIKNRVGFVSDESLLYPDKSVRWIAEFVHRLYSKWDGDRFE